MRRTGPARPDERGSGTLIVLVASGLLMFFGVAVGGVAAIVLAHRSAQAAADLAALAAASAGASGVEPCPAAQRIAEANEAFLVHCQIAGDVATIVVRVDGPQLVGHRYDVTAEARAGPAVQGP